jgi:hypothetical protein
MRYDLSGKLIFAPTGLSNHLGCHHPRRQIKYDVVLHAARQRCLMSQQIEDSDQSVNAE